MENDSTKQRFRRSQFAVVLVLSPLNATFERKCLVVPFAPDVLKLGRQTTTRTSAAPDNGYFDSRVLSRQHAEVWADKDTGKVWLRDCKSSNGTYINKHRLSQENTESEPHELKKNDHLDLGIDIVCNDDTQQTYRKISAKVEKVSMLPLHVGLQQKQQTQHQRQLQSPQLSRSPSLETLRSVNTQGGSAASSVTSFNGRQAEAIFGSSSVEALALTHANTTAGGLMIKESVKNQVDFEMAAKRLVSEIRSVRADTAKILSVATLLEEIKTAALEAEQQDKAARDQLEKDQKELTRREQERKDRSKSSSLAALKAENARIRAELTHILRTKGLKSHERSSSGSAPHSYTKTASSALANGNAQQQQQQLGGSLVSSANSGGSPLAGGGAGTPSSTNAYSLTPATPSGAAASASMASSSKEASQLPDSKVVQHNILVLVGTTILVTLTGVWIMFFFNPPMAPRSQNALFFNILLNQ